VAALSVVMIVLALVIATADGRLGNLTGGSITFSAGMAIVGGLIATRRPRHRIGWLLLFIGLTQAMVEFSSAYAHYALLYRPGSLPLGDVSSWFEEWMWMPGFGLAATLLLLFPTGRLPSRRWWPVAAVTILTLLTMVVADAIASWPHRGLDLANSTGPPGAYDPVVIDTSIAILGGCLILSFASLALRYRGADADERRQLKWITYAAIVDIAGTVAAFDVPFPGPYTAGFAAVASLALPVAIGAAILKYRLYDIDVVISRTLVYGALAAFITAVYVGIVVGVGTLVGSGGKPNLVLSIVATAVVAVGFQPVRERLQKVANRLVYGKRATPYEVLSQFSERAAESYAADDVLPRMAHVLADGTGAEQAEVWLRSGPTLRPAAVWPNADGAAPTESPRSVPLAGDTVPEIPEATRVVEVRHQGELLGALTVSKRQGESLTPVEEKLLDDLASQAGLVLKNVGLTAELLARLEELRASRQRLVAAQDEERRRLERNLHDGAQQNLVALKVKLGLAEVLAEKDPARAKALVGELKSDADEALETLRDLARGIYPPLLADKGLAAALEGQARKATVPVIVDADGIGRYPQDIEAAVYFCVLEAMQNVQKYAHATRASVRLSQEGGALSFEVEDDGDGFDPETVKRGAGLTNMADRLDALGGKLEVAASAGSGTRLIGSIGLVPTAVAAS
jgi:signal transduction histidine kinase